MSNVSLPPAGEVLWWCARNSNINVNLFSCVVRAQTWKRACELAMVKLQCGPGELEVRRMTPEDAAWAQSELR